jgi:hypothetical protein
VTGIEHLDEEIEYLGVRFLQFIKKQDHRTPLPDHPAQCTRITLIDAQQALNRIHPLILRQIKAVQPRVPKEVPGAEQNHFGLAGPGRSHGKKYTPRPVATNQT